MIIFQKYGYKYLFGKYEPIHQKSLLKIITIDLRNICKVSNIPYNIKLYSIHINMISNFINL